MSTESFYYRCDVEELLRLGLANGSLDEVRLPMPTPSVRQFEAIIRSWIFKITSMAEEILRKGELSEESIVEAVDGALKRFILRNINTEDDLRKWGDTIFELMSDGSGFIHRVSETLKSGGNPWMDKVDATILLNWEVNTHWHFVPMFQGEPTLPDEFSHPLKSWSDNAALEYVRYFSGQGNLSHAALVQRRKRWGLHPEQPTLVKSARIVLVENPRANIQFPWSQDKKAGGIVRTKTD